MLAVVVVVGLAMVYMGARQLCDPARSAGESTRYRARREGLDVENPEPTPATVERARKGGYALLGLGIAFLLLVATQLIQWSAPGGETAAPGATAAPRPR